MGKRATIHFLTAYVEYLLDQGIRSEEYYLGDASRFLRFLLANTTAEQVQSYIRSHSSPAYRARLEKTLRSFSSSPRKNWPSRWSRSWKDKNQIETWFEIELVGATRFERATFASRTRRSTKLSHAPQLKYKPCTAVLSTISHTFLG